MGYVRAVETRFEQAGGRPGGNDIRTYREDENKWRTSSKCGGPELLRKRITPVMANLARVGHGQTRDNKANTRGCFTSVPRS